MGESLPEFHIVPLSLDGEEATIMIEQNTTFHAPICEACGAIIGDEALHEEWHAHHD